MKPAELPELVLSRKDLAATLRLSLRTVDKLPIPSFRIGKRRLYKVEDVKAFVRKQEAA